MWNTFSVLLKLLFFNLKRSQPPDKHPGRMPSSTPKILACTIQTSKQTQRNKLIILAFIFHENQTQILFNHQDHISKCQNVVLSLFKQPLHWRLRTRGLLAICTLFFHLRAGRKFKIATITKQHSRGEKWDENESLMIFAVRSVRFGGRVEVKKEVICFSSTAASNCSDDWSAFIEWRICAASVADDKDQPSIGSNSEPEPVQQFH